MADSPRAPLPDGTQLHQGEYIIETHLGTGAFGMTYCAREPGLERQVAIKEFFPQDCRRRGLSFVPGGEWEAEDLVVLQQEFYEEARRLARLKKHAGIISIYRVFKENATVYLVMEFVEGRTVREYLMDRGGKLPVSEALTIIQQAGDALKIVHGAGLLHRDLKPGNIMRSVDGQIVLIDFGSARENLASLEMSQTEIYTPGYAAPEQHQRRAVRNASTDVYGLAATAYRILTGKRPLDAVSRAAGEPLLGVREFGEEVPEYVAAAILQGLALTPADRPQTIQDFLALLKQAPVDPPTVPVSLLAGRRSRIETAQLEPTRRPETVSPRSANPVDGAEMILIPAGEFIMGSNIGLAEERPERKVILESYYIYKSPVTVEQYRMFCLATGREMPHAPAWGWIDNHPIVNVNWDDARAYCDWAGVMLPTESQWEKAARGTDGRPYPWGRSWESSRCHCVSEGTNEISSTLPIGSFPSGASPYGVLDMVGNVWEWCANIFFANPTQKPSTQSTSVLRVIRGGSWSNSNPINFRASYRNGVPPGLKSSYYGFRCVSRLKAQ